MGKLTDKLSQVVTGASFDLPSAGIGGVSYIGNPGAEASTTGYLLYADTAQATPVDGTGGAANLTLTRDTSVLLYGSASFKLSKDAANRQGQGMSYDFTISQADKSRKLTIQLTHRTDQTAGYAAGDLSVYVYDVTNSTLITPSSISIPRGTGTLVFSFDTSTSTSYRLIFHVATTNATAWDCYFDNISISPREIVQGAAISEWQLFVPTGSWSTNTTYSGYWRRVGANMEIKAYVTVSGAPTAATLLLNLPPGYTIDTTKLTGTSVNTEIYGYARLLDAGVSNKRLGYVVHNNTTSVRFMAATPGSGENDGNIDNTVPMTWGAGDSLWAGFTVPIAEWSGSGTINLGPGAQVEYAWNSDVTNADSTATGFSYGPQGTPFGSYSGVARVKRARFQYPIQSDDLIVLEIQEVSGGPWFEINHTNLTIDTCNLVYQDTTRYGMGMSRVAGSTTDIDVIFGAYSRPAAATYGGVGTAWSSVAAAARWRVRKAKPSSPVGFGVAGTDGSSGLYQAGRAPGIITGATIASGYIGETVEATTNGVAYSGATDAYQDIASIVLTPGKWSINLAMFASANATNASTRWIAFIGTVAGNNTTGQSNMGNRAEYTGNMSNVNGYTSLPAYVVNISSSTTYYAKFAMSYTTLGSVSVYCRINAIRIG